MRLQRIASIALLLASCNGGGDPAALDRLESRLRASSQGLSAERVHYNDVHHAYDLLVASGLQADITRALGRGGAAVRSRAQDLAERFAADLRDFRFQGASPQWARDHFVSDVVRTMSARQEQLVQEAARFLGDVSTLARETEPKIPGDELPAWFWVALGPMLCGFVFVTRRMVPRVARGSWKILRHSLPETLREEALSSPRVLDELVERHREALLAELPLPDRVEVETIAIDGKPVDVSFVPPDVRDGEAFVAGVHQVMRAVAAKRVATWRVSLRAKTTDDARAFAGAFAHAAAVGEPSRGGLPAMLPVYLPSPRCHLVEEVRVALGGMGPPRFTDDELDVLLRQGRVLLILGGGEDSSALYEALSEAGVPTSLRGMIVIGAERNQRLALDVTL